MRIFRHGLLISALVLSLISVGRAKEKTELFRVGECLRYTVRWEMVPAGTATFRVRDILQIAHMPAWHFELEVRSNQYIDLLYKIRDRYEGLIDIRLTQSLLYRKTQSGKDKKQVVVAFDRESGTAVYSNYGEKRPPLPILPDTVDPLSAFYKMRTMDFDSEKTISFSVTDGKKKFMQTVEVIDRQTLVSDDGKSWDTYLIVPSAAHFSGVFAKSDDPGINIWVTADERKIPVRIEVKVFIGHVVFDLAGIEPL